MAEPPNKEIKLFYCYAREDRNLRDELEKHLSGLKRRYNLTNWHDREIIPGTDWEKEIDRHLTTAHLILLLISPDFLVSNYCYGKEMQRALERHYEGSCHVVPILLRPTLWEDEPFSSLQLLPTDARAITRWPDRDEAFEDVAKGISKAIKDILISLKTEEDLVQESKLRHEVEELQRSIREQRKAEARLEKDFEIVRKTHQLEIEKYQSRLREMENELNRKQVALQDIEKHYKESNPTIVQKSFPKKEVNPSERHNPDRLKRGERTPEGNFYLPILKALNELGGSAKMSDVLDKVEQSMKSELKPVDYEPLATEPKIARWRITARFTRAKMKDKGLLKSNSPAGIWEITEAGRLFLLNKVR